jgi:hypothetical protein
VNDNLACGGGGYMGCAMNSGNLEIARYLFASNFNANWLVNGRTPLVAGVIDLGPFGSRDDFVVALFDLFMQNGVLLSNLYVDYATPGIANPTVLDWLMSKCLQPHQQYPRYNRLIRDAIDKDPSNSNKGPGMAALSNIIAYAHSHPGGDVANCESLARNSDGSGGSLASSGLPTRTVRATVDKFVEPFHDCSSAPCRGWGSRDFGVRVGITECGHRYGFGADPSRVTNKDVAKLRSETN